MSNSKLFSTGAYKTIENGILGILNSQANFLSNRTSGSTRAAGDAIQSILSEHFRFLLGEYCTEYWASFPRRAMEDLAFKDADGFYYAVDVKTHRRDVHFAMPNLTSVKRLAKLYREDSNYFVLLLVKYQIEGVKLVAHEAKFVPIEYLDWNCLTLGALGWGQIQIANANVISVNDGYSRKKWMLELCDTLFDFYPAEISKIKGRISHFEKVRERWAAKPND